MQENEREKLFKCLYKKQFQVCFRDAVEVKKSWDGLFSFQLLEDTLEEDRKLYEDDKIFLCRRNSAKIFSDSKQWSKLVTEAFWQIVCGREDEAVAKFRKMYLYNSLCDVVYHLNYFEIVKQVMEERGIKVYNFGYNHASIHDIDKLHPVMLVAFAEKFDDHKNTLLWDIALQNHININSHHQGNSLWIEESKYSEVLRNVALGEMICDKVSRRLQKDLKGKIDEDMWNVDPKYFEGLPSTWLLKASEILASMIANKEENI